ncbi:aldehyde dehydrogenase [Moniliophthora roreri MCA 2997]|uniref:Aldehyde dehydrogenase n=1 Tax=Moniliophthora roreri (strain MCA 2997) TaxID=1381753 RepID=V2XM49_MONRO|nr:aldehyde dehydrogenase [Moniliophthora roreri MCA 2997]
MSKLQYTPLDEIEKIHTELKNGFNSGKTKSIAYRKYQLLQLMYMMKDNGERFEEALKADLGRPPLESQFFEVASCIVEIKHTYAHIDKWVKPEKPPFSLNWTPMRPVIYKEPKGVVLIISPFNYPVFLTVPILASALAAGNAVVIKPSESTPATSALLAELIHQYLDTSLVRVVNGAIPETTRLLELPWGHLLYTGGGRVAKVVSAAAAKTLTPVSLELGGKSPVFIDPNCDLKIAARRILWGKIANAGQTCVAPDYIFVTEDFQDKLVAALKEAHAEFYPNGPKEPGAYSRLCTPQAFNRVNGLLQNTRGHVAIGGEVDESDKFIAPTVVTDVKPGDSLMSEEIFGPVLPIVPIKNWEEAIAFVNSNDHPLSLYVFSNDENFKQKVFRSTQSGSAIANETIIHPAAEGLPFGGIGPSGSGYHSGKYGFDMFTHLRSSLDSPSWIESLLAFRYPPYTAKKFATMNRTFMPRLPARPKGPPPPDADEKSGSSWAKWLTFILAAALAGGLLEREKVLQAIGY